MTVDADSLLNQPAVIVSCDSHVGPLVREHLRAYCPGWLLDDFDRFAELVDSARALQPGSATGREAEPNARTTGGWDVRERIRHQDSDGISVSVLFQGLAGNAICDPLPFNGGFGAYAKGYPPTHVAEGRRIYNRWLADFVSEAPERFIALGMLPMDSVESAVAEAQAIAHLRLNGVHLPRHRPDLPAYNSPAWYPLWSLCEDWGLTLNTHSQSAEVEYTNVRDVATVGGAFAGRVRLPGDRHLVALDMNGPGARSAVEMLVLGGVFQKFPNLRMIVTENFDTPWYHDMALRLDSRYRAVRRRDQRLGRRPSPEELPVAPSEYLRNVYVGATCLARFEVEHAQNHGYLGQVLWGSDYPHSEGTWQDVSHISGAVPVTHLAIRDAMAALPPEDAARLLGGNAARFYDLDMTLLHQIAAKIGAPSLRDLTTPLESVPDYARSAFLCFRRRGPFD